MNSIFSVVLQPAFCLRWKTLKASNWTLKFTIQKPGNDVNSFMLTLFSSIHTKQSTFYILGLNVL